MAEEEVTNVYELARLERIQRNRAMLQALGFACATDAQSDTTEKEPAHQRPKKRAAPVAVRSLTSSPGSAFLTSLRHLIVLYRAYSDSQVGKAKAVSAVGHANESVKAAER